MIQHGLGSLATTLATNQEIMVSKANPVRLMCPDRVQMQLDGMIVHDKSFGCLVVMVLLKNLLAVRFFINNVKEEIQPLTEVLI